MDETLDQMAARMQKFKAHIALIVCPCGNELETDLPVGEFLTKPCSRCGETAWKVRREVGRKIANDPTAPLEIIQEREKGE